MPIGARGSRRSRSFDRSNARLLEAISHATPRALDPSIYGEAGLDSTHESQQAQWIREWRTARAAKAV